MASERDLRLALEFISEGEQAVVPRAQSREVFSTESFRAETRRIRQQSRPWTQGPGIQGLGLGEKISGGKVGKDLALRVYVARKKPLSKVRNRVPKRVRVPEVGEFATDVEEIGIVGAESFRERVRPAMPGCGLGHPNVSVGTFGCLVRKRGDASRLYILSNSHVLADEGLAKIGDPILQPGPFDGGGRGDRLARLSEFQPFAFSRVGYLNHVDAAIAEVDPRRVDAIIRILGIEPAGVGRTLRRGMQVQKVGRTTDHTVGVVRDVNYRFSLPYTSPGSGRRSRVGFRDQVLCSRYTAGGDSGSLVLNRRGYAVGLHFAGSPSTSIFSRIRDVFGALKIELA
jgi:hypothetical protein